MLNRIDWFDFVVGGIVIGFVVNVLANIAYPRLENWWGKYSETRRSKNEAKRRAFSDRVEHLISNKHDELVLRIQVNRDATFGIFMALLGLTAMLLPVTLRLSDLSNVFIGIIPGLVGFSRAMYTFIRRNELVEILNAVDRKLDRHFT